MADMFLKFSELLDRGLQNTATKITKDIKADLHSIGSRIEIIENHLETTIARTNQNTSCIQTLQDQLETAHAKIDDLENRNRRYNFRVRGLPESYKDVPEAIFSFIKELIPEIPLHRLELDQAHRALWPPRSDGLPGDVVVKPHFYAVKEEVMRKSRASSKLTYQGHELQIFADLSPSTIQKRRTLKTTAQHLDRKRN